MSSSEPSRRQLLLLGAAAVSLGACGFEPVYAPGSAARGLRGAVLYQEPTDPDQFDIARQVEQRLGMASAPRFGLAIQPVVDEESLAVAAEEDITRFDLIGRASYELTDLATGQVVMSGEVDSFTSYSATGTTVSTQAAERNARSRLMVALTDLVLTRLIASADRFAG